MKRGVGGCGRRVVCRVVGRLAGLRRALLSGRSVGAPQVQSGHGIRIIAFGIRSSGGGRLARGDGRVRHSPYGPGLFHTEYSHSKRQGLGPRCFGGDCLLRRSQLGLRLSPGMDQFNLAKSLVVLRPGRRLHGVPGCQSSGVDGRCVDAELALALRIRDPPHRDQPRIGIRKLLVQRRNGLGQCEIRRGRLVRFNRFDMDHVDRVLSVGPRQSLVIDPQISSQRLGLRGFFRGHVGFVLLLDLPPRRAQHGLAPNVGELQRVRGSLQFLLQHILAQRIRVTRLLESAQRDLRSRASQHQSARARIRRRSPFSGERLFGRIGVPGIRAGQCERQLRIGRIPVVDFLLLEELVAQLLPIPRPAQGLGPLFRCSLAPVCGLGLGVPFLLNGIRRRKAATAITCGFGQSHRSPVGCGDAGRHVGLARSHPRRRVICLVLGQRELVLGPRRRIGLVRCLGDAQPRIADSQPLRVLCALDSKLINALGQRDPPVPHDRGIRGGPGTLAHQIRLGLLEVYIRGDLNQLALEVVLRFGLVVPSCCGAVGLVPSVPGRGDLLAVFLQGRGNRVIVRIARGRNGHIADL